ncbi:hypothetical protein BOX15_Mlig005024g1 [Macrostomum lignano]|uniref:poly(A)-specific ribonuclease n=2 Tax=Macrostomum lignano TaxID=282301 RepID=A0A1I8FUY8_9PLAT|nr:hypothetical protein BOX15_Mlig005024g1 [Macrostomum lignano]
MQRKRKWEPGRGNLKQVVFLTQEDKEQGAQASWEQLEIVGNIHIFPPDLCNMTYLKYLFMGHNQLASIPPEISLLKNLVHLDLSYNQLKSLPPQIGALTELKELHLQGNQIRNLPMQIGRLFQLNVLNLHNNPLNPEVAQLYNTEGVHRMLSWYLDNESLSMPPPPPPSRNWRYLRNPSDVNESIAFTLMCYNVLCEGYATRKQYPYCPSWALLWDYRRRGIMTEIRVYQADIICLQEVETEQFSVFFKPELAKDGYDGIFSPKSRAKTMSASESRYVDGVAIFWKKERFTLIKEDVIEFSRMAVERYETDCKESQEMINRVMLKDNIAVMAIFEVRDEISGGPPRQMVVSTAHIHWDPEFCDVKLIQTILLLSALWKKIENHMIESQGADQKGQVDVTNMPVIICGDFNSLPDSGVFEYLTNGRVKKSHLDFKELGYERILDRLTPHRSQHQPDYLEQDFNLSRCYQDDVGMPYTNYTYEFKGCIDYIFFTERHFNNIGCLDMVPEAWFQESAILGCPHPHVPSDHFSLLVELELKPQHHQQQHRQQQQM